MSDTEDNVDQTKPLVNLRKISRNELDVEQELRAEIEKEDLEIEALRAKAEERKRRQEEEAKKQEEEKARIEREKKAKEEEEKKRKEELAQKRKQQEIEKLQAEAKKIEQDMVVLGEAGGSKLSNVLKAKEDMQKSPEQLEREKREIISSRLISLDLNGKTKDDLVAEAERFYQVLINLHSQIYDLNEKHERQKYDMMELAERARQIEKGKAKTRKSNIVHTGLGGSVFSSINDKFPQAPQKISLFSRYERVTDRRTFKDRREVWEADKPKKEFVPERPKAKIKHVEVPANDFKRKPKKSGESVHHEEHHEEVKEPEHQEDEEHHEEEHHEEEAPAEEE
jgi:hypothetical protein